MSRGLIRDDVTDSSGNALSGILVNVYLPGTTTKATLYDASSGGSAVNNPLTTNALGVFEAFADTGEYDIVVEAPTGDITVSNFSALDADDVPSQGARLTTAEADIVTLETALPGYVTDAEAAQTAAEAAQAAAETAQTGAETAETNAGVSETNAAASASAAADSATAADASYNDIVALNQNLAAISQTYAGLDIVASGVYPVGDWRQTVNASYMTEAVPSGRYLGEFDTLANAVASGAVVGDWYYDNAGANLGKFKEITDIGVPSQVDIYRAGSQTVPALIGVVATTSRVIIFDMTKQTPEMWMEFTAGGGLAISNGGGGSLSSVAFAGSRLYVGSPAANGALSIVDFADDYAAGMVTDATGQNVHHNLADRNVFNNNDITNFFGGGLVDRNVNSVAALVRSGETTTNDAGVLIPTVLVGTDGGVSQIDADGTVYDLVSTTANNDVLSVAFNESGPDILFTASDSGGVDRERFGYHHAGLMTADSSTLGYTANANVTLFKSVQDASPEALPNINFTTLDDNLMVVGTNTDNEFVFGGQEILVPYQFNESTPLASLGAYIRAASNTGWMVGDVQTAIACDTDTATLGDERITNGDFATDTVWTKGTGWTIGSGVATRTNTGSTSTLAQSATLTVGKTYRVEFEVTAYTSGGVRPRLTGGTAVDTGVDAGATGVHVYYLTAVSGNNGFDMRATSTFAGSIDNVRVHETGIQDGTFSVATAASTGGTPTVGTYWTLTGTAGSSAEITGGALVLTIDGSSSNAFCSQSGNLTIGKTYRYTYTASVDAGTAPLTVSNQINLDYEAKTITTTPTEYTGTFVATTYSDIGLKRGAGATSVTFTVTDFSVVEVLNDYSGNANHFNIVGELGQVAQTGGEIAGLTGFSATDYAESEAGADGITTGDFCFSFWVDLTATGVDQALFMRADPALGFSGPDIRVAHFQSTDELHFRIDAADVTATSGLSGLLFVVAQRNAGTMELYVNNVSQGTTANATDLTDANATVLVGLYHDFTKPSTSPIYNFRQSLTAMTAAQVAKAYRDERLMLTGNATLSGTSDAVTSLTYDSKRNRVHAATSGGVSVFNALTRVDTYTGDDAVAAHDDATIVNNAGDTGIAKPEISLRELLAELRG